MVEHSDKNYLNELIKKRKNIKFFSDKIPDKDIIKKILDDTLAAAPVKNNIYHYSLEVYGPEFYEAKKSLLLQTLCVPKARNPKKGLLKMMGTDIEKIRVMTKDQIKEAWDDGRDISSLSYGNGVWALLPRTPIITGVCMF